MKSTWIFIFFSAFQLVLHAQSTLPIGQWRDHVPFRFAKSVFIEGATLTAATQYGLFRYSTSSKEFERLTKSNGLSEVEIKIAEKDPASTALLVVYENQNLDLIEGDKIRNIPDVLNSKVQGDKTINNLRWIGKDAYLSSNLGIVVLNSVRAEIKATYRIGMSGTDMPVYQVALIGNVIYAATNLGLRKTSFDSISMRNYQSWTTEKITWDQEVISNVVNWNNQVVVQKSDSVFLKENARWKLLYGGPQRVSCLSVRNNALYLGLEGVGQSKILVFKNNSALPQALQIPSLTVAKGIDENNGILWIADEQRGVIQFNNGREEIISPNSPNGISSGRSFIQGNRIWATAGRVEKGLGKNYPGEYFEWDGSSWINFTAKTNPFLDSLPDVHQVVVEPEAGLLIGGSFGGGLFELDKSGRSNVLKQNAYLVSAAGTTSSYKVGGLVFDKKQTLWISNTGAPQSLIAKPKQGDLRKFSIPLDAVNYTVGNITVDSENRKWLVGGSNNGLVCFDDGGTLDRTSDDRWRFFRQGKGSGNLPSSNVLSVAEDRNGFIWVGTDRGVAIIQCLDDVFNASRCEAVLPIVQQNNIAGVLLAEEQINDMKVDGADRKWIASSNGVWLLSADGQQVLYRFTAENSPLLCNSVYEITVDGKTGEVYFHTECGISVFRSTATDPEVSERKANVFPNPVPSGFNGSIAIRNLPGNAWVRIAELDGKLVYQTRSLGGQAIWNGRNYKGERINSGVYLVYISDENNQQQLAAKIFFIQ